MKVQYYILDNDPDGECLYEFDYENRFVDLEWIAEAASEDYDSAHDGWEDSWPLDLVVLHEGDKHLFRIEKEHHPVFSAMPMEWEHD